MESIVVDYWGNFEWFVTKLLPPGKNLVHAENRQLFYSLEWVCGMLVHAPHVGANVNAG
jgi:hypothetical protein